MYIPIEIVIYKCTALSVSTAVKHLACVFSISYTSPSPLRQSPCTIWRETECVSQDGEMVGEEECYICEPTDRLVFIPWWHYDMIAIGRFSCEHQDLYTANHPSIASRLKYEPTISTQIGMSRKRRHPYWKLPPILQIFNVLVSLLQALCPTTSFIWPEPSLF